MMREIEYLSIPLPMAMEHAALAAGNAALLFELAASTLQEGYGVSGEEAWLSALTQTAAWWQEEEKSALATAAPGLGSTDAASQSRRLELARQRVAGCEQLAKEREDKYGRIWRSMGWASGALLVLLLV